MINYDSFLKPLDDGLPMRESGSWAAEKLDYLRRYIEVFETSMRTKWKKRYYIDLFAGPGKCRCRETNKILLGSPLIAMTTKHPFTNYVFADMRKENLDALSKRIESTHQYPNTQFFIGDSNKLIMEN